MTTTKRVAIYARVSTKDQDCGMQLADLERMAEARGFEIVARYVDQAVSSVKDRRPELDELMTDARRGEFQAVLVWKFDRFARSLKELVNALEEFGALGVDFVSHQEALDTSTPIGKMLFQVIGAMAEFERSLIRERVAAGIRHARERGVTLGRPRATFNIEQARALRARGASYRDIGKALGVGKDVIWSALHSDESSGGGPET